MEYERAYTAAKLRRWEQYLRAYNLPTWEELPDIDLYMEQVIVLLTKYLDFLPKGEKEEKVYDYLKGACKCLLQYVVIDKDRQGWVKRFGNTSSSHAALIAAVSGDTYALSVKGSALACGNTPDLYETMEFCDDLTGSAEYKKYLAKTVFSLRR